MPDQNDILVDFRIIPPDRLELVATRSMRYAMWISAQTRGFIDRGQPAAQEIARHIAVATPELAAALADLLEHLRQFHDQLAYGEAAFAAALQEAIATGETAQ